MQGQVRVMNIAINGSKMTITKPPEYVFIPGPDVATYERVGDIPPKLACDPPGQIFDLEILPKNNNDPSKEFLVLTNKSSEDIALAGCFLSTKEDSNSKVYTFSTFTLGGGKSVSIWTRSGTDDAQNLYIGQTRLLWGGGSDGGNPHLMNSGGKRIVAVFNL